MSDSRQAILDGVRRALGRGPLSEAEAAALDARLAMPQANLVPERARLDPAGQVALFVAMAEEASATVERVADEAAVPAAMAAYLARENLPAEAVAAPALSDLPWGDRPMLKIRYGVPAPEDRVGLTGAFAGIAETGTLMLISGPESPTTLNFLPETHVVVLRTSQVMGSYEDGWAALRRARKDAGLPRTVNFITGPSRSADIEQTLLMGAHGPRRLHIIVVDDRR